ncbi:DUF4236 domain-containing protein [Tepidicella baoligensis]|uniref:DUF4236 domain-containing protein n=1 Tax=Tepidicella baoligensis TaxID=2707016 RepID=UPI0015DA59E1
MSFRFFRRFRIAPGLILHLSKGGVSVCAGPRGAKFTASTRGTRATVGWPALDCSTPSATRWTRLLRQSEPEHRTHPGSNSSLRIWSSGWK